jgi:hypothetical protein
MWSDNPTIFENSDLIPVPFLATAIFEWVLKLLFIIITPTLDT